MKTIDDLLMDKKEELNQINVPDELELRLKNALESKKIKKTKRYNWRIGLVTACLLIILTVYNIDTLAYYGKKIIGFENIMNGTLTQLNELGKGQIIDKSFTFSNGVIVTLDGVMLDDNQLLGFYTIKSPEGNIDNISLQAPIYMKGFMGSYMEQSGQGKMNDEKTEIKWITEFGTPLFLEKTLSFEFALINDKNIEKGKIVFVLDRSKAMGHILKKNINQKIGLEGATLKFNTIMASPIKTVIKGSIQNVFELAIDQLTGERLYPRRINLKLLANGKELNPLGSGMSTNNNGITFESEYDALPKNLEKLQLLLESFCAEHEVNEQIQIDEDINNKSLDINSKNIVLNKLYKKDNNTYLTITTDEDIILTRTKLIVDDKVVDLKNTTTNNHEKTDKGVIYHTRTLCFPGVGESYKLDIQRMTYSEIYNITIDIPIE